MSCATCRFWEKDNDREDGFGICGLTKSEADPRGDIAESLAHAEDYESYKAELATSPEFHCNQYYETDEERKRLSYENSPHLFFHTPQQEALRAAYEKRNEPPKLS